jgi:hypothetical protein
MATVYLPIALVVLWGDDGRPPPDGSASIKALDHAMHLFQAVTIAMRFTVTAALATAYRTHMKLWINDLRELYPKVAQQKRTRTNIHMALHIYDFLLQLGPVISWWAFPFERLIGVLQKITTNNRVGGEMETTIVNSFLIGSNLRRWLRRSDCPPAILELRHLFNKVFPPLTPAAEELHKPVGTRQCVAYYSDRSVFGTFIYSPSSTHLGNSMVIYCSSRFASRPSAGQIERIDLIDGFPQFMIRRQSPLPEHLYDPFLRYPDFPARCYSSHFSPKCDVVGLDSILSHAAVFRLDESRLVYLNLSRL